jgi:hypothetical protein
MTRSLRILILRTRRDSRIHVPSDPRSRAHWGRRDAGATVEIYLLGVAQQRVNVVLLELLPAFEEIQFHYEAQAGDFRAQ